MPTVTRWFVKLSFIYLVLALLIGVGLVAQGLGWIGGRMALLSPVYFHFFMVGWVTQFIFGVAHWMLPNYSAQAPRGRESLIWGTLVTVNAGLILRALAEPFMGQGGIWGWMLVLSALLQWTGVMLFIINTWPRVRPRRLGG